MVTLLLQFMLSTFFLATTTSFILSIFRPRLPYPPSPPGWPFFPKMGLLSQMTHRDLALLSNQYATRGLLQLRIAFLRTIVISTPDAARQVLQQNDHLCSNRPATIAIRYLTYDRADMAFAHYGPFWRQMRKICVLKLFSRRRAESWASVRDEVDRMVHTLAGSRATTVNVGEMVFGLTRKIVYRAAFGSRSDEGQSEFIGIMQEFSMLFGAFNMADFIPMMGWMDPHGLKGRLKAARAALDGFIDTIIDDHIEKRKNGSSDEREDMVDELLAFYTHDQLQPPPQTSSSSFTLTRNNIKGIIMDVMFGGTETVASAIEWTMAELLRNPMDLKKVQQELSTVVGLSRKVEDSDLENLPYLRCCLKEVLRLHPPIPLLLHETAAHTTISGYNVPSKSRLVINVWAIGRDKGAWEEAEAFKPARFLSHGAPDFKGKDFEFIPFGSGRRSCPGMQLGLYALEVAVAHLLHCFDWELAQGMKASDMDMGDVFGLTAPRATRLTAVANPRLLCPLL